MTQHLNRPSLRSMRSIIILATITTAVATLTGCNNVSPSTPNAQIKPAIKLQTELAPAVQAVIGDYASEDYANRTQGYDWVGVIIRSEGNEQINIKVRARSDVKKPTCQFDGKATLMGQDEAHGIFFQTKVDDSAVFFQFKDNKLTIDSQDRYVLKRFCSGGGTIIGEYKKLAGSLELN